MQDETKQTNLPVPTQADVLEFMAEARASKTERDRQAAIRWGQRYGVDPGAKPFTLSQSTIGDLHECPFKFYLGKILGIHTVLTGASMAYGSAIDEAVTERLGINGSLDKALCAFLSKWEEQLPDIEFPDGPQAWTPAEYRTSGQLLVNTMEPHLDRMQPVHVAKWLDHQPLLDPVSLDPVDGFALAGKVDIVDLVRPEGFDEDVACITDTKALVSLTKPENQYLCTRLSLQLVAYAWSAQADEMLRELPGIGTVVSYFEGQRKKPPAAPKMKKDGTPCKTKPAEPPKVQRTFADIGADEFREVLGICYNAAMIVTRCREREAGGVPPELAWPRNMAACNTNRYNMACEFRPFCRCHLMAEHPGLDVLYTTAPIKY